MITILLVPQDGFFSLQPDSLNPTPKPNDLHFSKILFSMLFHGKETTPGCCSDIKHPIQRLANRQLKQELYSPHPFNIQFPNEKKNPK